MKLFQKFIVAAYLSEAKNVQKEQRKYIKKSSGDRSVEDIWDLSDDINSELPSEACTAFGKHSYTGEDGFGMDFGYELSYQGSDGGLNGFLYLDNYHSFMNCYVDITAAPECEAISIEFTSVAVEQCDYRIGNGPLTPACECDRFWISNDNMKFPQQCGCTGDGCNDVLWSRNITHPITGEEDYYSYYYGDEYENPDGSYNLTAIYENVGSMSEGGSEGLVHHKTGQIVLGNKFRFNFQSDYSWSHGEVRLDWECIDAAPTTAITEWSTTSGTTTTQTTTTVTTTTPYTTSTITEPYPSCHPGLAGPGCATTTTNPGLPDGNYESVTWNGDSCYRYPQGRETFRTRMMTAISSAVANDRLSLSHNGQDTNGSAMRQTQFTTWLQNVFDLFYEDITAEDPRECLAEKFKDSVEQGETGLIASHFLSNDELGSDCALDIEDENIDNACAKLKSFFEWAYADCKTGGIGVLSRLEARCDRINEIRQIIADRE